MRKILIIEDEPDIQELLAAYLRDAGYEIVIAGDGVEALAQFQQGAFDMILLDLMLPKIDGFGVCELIRRESSVPILMLTALDGEQEQLRGFQMEIDDYVTKPFSMTTDMFISLVRKYTRTRKLTPRMLNELVEKIEVYHAEKIDGVWEQRLRIHYNCVGEITIPKMLPLPIPDVTINTRKGVFVNYAPAEIAG